MYGGRFHLARGRSVRSLSGLLLALTVLVVSGRSLRAQDATPEIVERAEVEALIAANERQPALDSELSDQLSDIYQETLTQLEAASTWRERGEEAEARRVSAPGKIAQLEERLAAELPPLALPEPSDESVDSLEPIVAQISGERANARGRVAELELETEALARRREDLPVELSEVGVIVSQSTETLSLDTSPTTDPRLAKARELRVRAQLQSAIERLRALEEERDGAKLADELLNLRRQEAARILGRAEKAEAEWNDRLHRAQSAEASEAAAAASAAAAAASHPLVAKVAAETAALANRRTGPNGLRKLIEVASEDRAKSERALAEIRDDRDSIERKEEVAGLSQEIGLLLVAKQRELPNTATRRASLTTRRVAEDKAEIERIDEERQLRRQFDPDRAVRMRMEGTAGAEGAEGTEASGLPLEEDERAQVESALREALLKQRQVRESLLSDLNSYIELLSELNLIETQLIDEIDEFAAFIDKRVLWVRIADPIFSDPVGFVDRARVAAARLLSPTSWGTITAQLPRVLKQSPLEIIVKLLALVGLLGMRRAIRRRIVDDAYLVARIRTDEFFYTARTLLLTVALALPLPLLLFWTARVLFAAGALTSLEASSLAHSISKGLEAVALALFVAEMIWATCRPKGLGEAHFRWGVASLRIVRRHLKWLMALGLPLVFLVVALERLDEREAEPSLGRLVFMGEQLLLLIFAWRVLRPEKGALSVALEKNPNGWLARLKGVWFPLSIGAPAILILMEALGYLYTASTLQERLRSTVFLILAVVLAHALLTRWLFVARRRLALAQFRKRRAAAQEKSDKADGSVSEEIVDEEVDLPSVSEQSLTLVQTATGVALIAILGLVWADILPALGFLDGFELWTQTIEVEELTALGDGTSGVDVVKKLVPVTLADLISAIVALVLTVISARNLPGLLEIMVLQRLPLQRAGRYAVTTISRYLIVIIGLAIMFGSVGIGWSTVQWLAAAVSVGLGFGLQEIFANFVSGLIILFERPIRVGDTVTVGTVTGTVNRIHMRATTIVTWDRTELIVPNREFITNQLVNWTLSDSVLRVIVCVGIAYGSDTKLAEKLLRQVAEEHPDVLPDPAPRIVFTEFGDSTLNFELRIFVLDPELYRTIHHPLNNAIDRLFRENGVEIAFPQRDLHLRTSEAPISVVRAEDIVRKGREPDEPEAG